MIATATYIRMEDSTRNYPNRAHTPSESLDSLFHNHPSSSQHSSMDNHHSYYSSSHASGGMRILSPHSESSSSASPRRNPMGIDRLTHRSVSPPLRASPSVSGGDDSPRLLHPIIYSTSQSPISAAQMAHYEQQPAGRFDHGISSPSSIRLPPLADIRQNLQQADDSIESTASMLMSLSSSGNGNNQRSPSTSLKPKLLPSSPPSLPHQLYSPGSRGGSSGGHWRGTDEEAFIGHNNSASMTVTAVRPSSSGGRSESAGTTSATTVPVTTARSVTNVDASSSPSSTSLALGASSNPSTPVITVTSATPNAEQSPASSPRTSRKRARSSESDKGAADDDEPVTKKPGSWKHANGFRRTMVPEDMVDIQAPTRPKKAAYNAKKPAKKGKGSPSSRDSADLMSPASDDVKMEHDELEEIEEHGEGETPEEAALNEKRRKNAVAARESRARKFQALRSLEDENGELKTRQSQLEADIETLKAKAEHLKAERDEAVGKLAVSKHWVKTHLNTEQVNHFDMHCA